MAFRGNNNIKPAGVRNRIETNNNEEKRVLRENNVLSESMTVSIVAIAGAEKPV